ncbi:MAG: cobalamin-dependent protein [Kiritimatiellae bacterium]|nr:cobalamin-dependent protein [Kiritimatiellia bacterium]
MRVAIAYPPLPSELGVPLLGQNRQFQWFNRPTFIYPVVPALAATMAKRSGHEVAWLDGIASGWTPEEFDRRLTAFEPDVVMIETKTPVVKRHWKIVTALKAKHPALTVVMVGDHVTALPAETMENCPVDFILTGGDYDFLLLELLGQLAGGGHDYPPGVWYRNAAGEVGNTGRFQLNHDLRTLPWIDRDLTCWKLYAERNGNYRKTPGTYIMSGRDCWHGKCTFCSWTTLYPNYRTRDPIDVADEIGDLIDRYGVREIMDDTGSFPVGEWLKIFCNEMIRRGYPKKLRIDCNMRFGKLDFETYQLMRKAGFRLVLFGLESANQTTLDRLVKALKVEEIERGAKEASKAGLDVHVTVMLGYPWEGEREIANTVCLARRLLRKGYAYTLQVTQVVPYPGTPLFREVRENGQLLTEDWDDFDMRRQVMRSGVPEEQIKAAIREVYRAFMHPETVLRRLCSTKSPVEDMKFYWRGFRSLLGHLRDFKS